MKIGNCLTSAQYGVSIAMNEDKKGYPIYRMNEIHNMLCDLEVDKYAELSSTDFEKFKLEQGDVLFNRTNSYEWVGRTGVYYPDSKNTICTFASYLVRFMPDNDVILSEYLATFLNTKYGVVDIKRRARQSINQTNVNPEEVKEIEIPILNSNIQKEIKSNFLLAHQFRVNASNRYHQAENLLLSELGIVDFTPSPDNIAVKSFKDSFSTTGRLDSEYYQLKYDDFERKIKKYHGGYGKIKEYFTLNEQNFELRKSAYNYIEIGDVDIGTTDVTYNLISTEKLPANAKIALVRDDILISKVRPYRGAVCIINFDKNDLVASGAFTVLHEKHTCKKEVLQVLLRTQIYKDWLLKWNVGSSYPVIKDKDILELVIPILPMAIQQQIADKIQKSSLLRKQGERLLESAKRAVEIAIEEDEETALVFLVTNKLENIASYDKQIPLISYK